jgi:hypothetical protein
MIPDDPNAFVNLLVAAKGVSDSRQIADEVMAIDDVNLQRRNLVLGTHANPFFVPHAKEGAAALNAFQLLYFVSQARLAAANSRTPRIVVSAPMKSGSTFISDSLSGALKLPKVNLMMLLARPYDYPAYGASTRPHEIDELALLSACLAPQGFVAHHHMVCSPFLAQQAELYNLKFVLLKRNIFDCIVSLDEFRRKVSATVAADNAESAYLRMNLPTNWRDMEDEERIDKLLNRFLPIYVHYHVSWRLLERQGKISPFWISYEDDLLADKAGLAQRLGTWLGRAPGEIDVLTSAVQREDNLQGVHFNKGVAGRGKAIQGANRKRVIDAFNDFKDLADWSEILD